MQNYLLAHRMAFPQKIQLIIYQLFAFSMPARRLTEADYQHITEIWETSGKHYEHELHILHPIFSISNMLFILCR